jgi:hypothetical protein
MRVRFAILAVSATIAAPGALAQAGSLGRMLACSDIPRAEERLQCYDSAARTAIGLGAAPAAAPEQVIRQKEAELAERERKLAEREILVRKLEAAVRDLKDKVVIAADNPPPPAPGSAPAPEPAAMAAPAAGDAALAAREAALAQREAALKAREAQMAALPASKAEQEATLFGIPIPFTRKDSFSQQTEDGGLTIERDGGGEVEAISAPIREWSVTGDGKLIAVLDNGQVWRQTDDGQLRLRDDPANPNVARIARGALGSFTMTVNGSSKSIKVRRVDGRKAK